MEGTMLFLLSEKEYIFEYYSENGAYDWYGEESEKYESIINALAIAGTFVEDYLVYLIVLVGEDSTATYMLAPSLDDSDLAEGLYNDYDAFSDAVLDCYIDMF